MRLFVLFILSLVPVVLMAEENVSKLILKTELVAIKDEEKTLEKLAFDIVIKDLGEKGWTKFCKDMEKSYDEWCNDNGNSTMNSYLNTRMLGIALDAKKGKLENVKKFVYWLALYEKYNAEPPSYLYKIMENKKEELRKIAKDFTWEKVAEVFKTFNCQAKTEDGKIIVIIASKEN